MIEQQHFAQERLVSAAKARKQKKLAQSQQHSIGWQPYVVTIIFITVLFGSRTLHPSDLDQHLIYIAWVVMYYGWLSFWMWSDGGNH